MKLQESAVRLIAGKNRKTHTAKLFKELNILQLNDLYKCSVISQFRSLQQKENFNNSLRERVIFQARNTRSNNKWKSKISAPTILEHVEIGNQYFDEIQSHIKTKTVLRNKAKCLVGEYKISCDKTKCYICKS